MCHFDGIYEKIAQHFSFSLRPFFFRDMEDKRRPLLQRAFDGNRNSMPVCNAFQNGKAKP